MYYCKASITTRGSYPMGALMGPKRKVIRPITGITCICQIGDPPARRTSPWIAYGAWAWEWSARGEDAAVVSLVAPA